MHTNLSSRLQNVRRNAGGITVVAAVLIWVAFFGGCTPSQTGTTSSRLTPPPPPGGNAPNLGGGPAGCCGLGCSAASAGTPQTLVLLTGGIDNTGGASQTADIYDSSQFRITPASGAMGTGRANHTSTLLHNRNITLIAGGIDATGTALDSAELFDPVPRTFSAAPSLSTARKNHVAVYLPDPDFRVLITGGIDQLGNVLQSAELLDQGQFVPRPMTAARANHAAAVLSTLQVVVTGGIGVNGQPLASSELFSPSGATFLARRSMNQPRAFHTATTLPNDLVLIAGGGDPLFRALTGAEVYDLVHDSWTPTATPMHDARLLHTATLLQNGKVLIVGGYDAGASNFNHQVVAKTTELYDPSTNSFQWEAQMITPRVGHTATLLKNGQVLVAGGRDAGNTILNTMEIYDPDCHDFTPVDRLTVPRVSHGAVAER
jgi:hypothetical protein